MTHCQNAVREKCGNVVAIFGIERAFSSALGRKLENYIKEGGAHSIDLESNPVFYGATAVHDMLLEYARPYSLILSPGEVCRRKIVAARPLLFRRNTGNNISHRKRQRFCVRHHPRHACESAEARSPAPPSYSCLPATKAAPALLRALLVAQTAASYPGPDSRLRAAYGWCVHTTRQACQPVYIRCILPAALTVLSLPSTTFHNCELLSYAPPRSSYRETGAYVPHIHTFSQQASKPERFACPCAATPPSLSLLPSPKSEPFQLPARQDVLTTSRLQRLRILSHPPNLPSLFPS